MKREYYRATAVYKVGQKEAEQYRNHFVKTGEKRAFVDVKNGKIFVHCAMTPVNNGTEKNGRSNTETFLLKSEIELPGKPYYQLTLMIKPRDGKVVKIVNKATGEIIEPFYVSKEGDGAKYAFCQTYLHGVNREAFVIEVLADGRVVIDDVSTPIRAGQAYFNLVSGVINERFQTYLGEDALEKELQKLPEFLTPAIGPILSAHQELEASAPETAMKAAFKNALAPELEKLLAPKKS